MTRRTPPAPPRIARALVRLLPAEGNHDFLASDLEEEFAEIAATAGLPAARRWYWKQACLSAPPLLRRRVATTSRLIAHAMGGVKPVFLQGVLTDLLYGWRMSRRRPVVTLSVTVAIALGIAASTAIFSVMESTFLRPLPFAEPDRLVRLSSVVEKFGVVPEVNYLDAMDYRASAARLDGIALYDVDAGTVRLESGAPAFAATVLAATDGLLSVLRVQPHAGRLFSPDEYRYGARPAVMLGYNFWRSHFAGDAAVVGRTLVLGTTRRAIVGVLPPAADRFPAGGADVWTPLTFPSSSFLNQRGSIALGAIARLRPGETVVSAQEELATLAKRLGAAYPDTNRVRGMAIDGLQDSMVGPVKPMMLLLAFSIAMLLAVACANIANLLLAQAHARGVEFGIRAAVGASPGRLGRQLWTETLGLFAVAGGVGVALAHPLALALIARYPETLPLAADVAVDSRVLAIAAACTLTAALLAGLPRVRRLRDPRAGADLRCDARTAAGPSHRRMANLFVAAQVSVSMVLLCVGILLLRTFMTLTTTPSGFNPRDVVTIRASIPSTERGGPAQTVAFQDLVADTARALPGVTSAAHAMFVPFTAGSWGDGYRRIGASDPPPVGPMAHFFMVSPEYFSVMGMPLLRGRGLAQTDDARAPGALVVSETFARQAFPDRDAVGQRIAWNDAEWEIVGVTADVRHAGLASPPDRDAYVPRRQVVRGNTWLLIKTTRPPGAILGELQERMKAVNPDVALTDAATMTHRIAESAAPERFRAIVTGTLACLTLILAIVGLHGVVSYAVAERTREIGVRLALGQQPGAVVRLVMAETLRTIAAGAVPGAVASIAAGRWLASIVMVTASLPATLAVVVAMFLTAALAAAAGPAWHASRVDPIRALRS